MLTRNSLIMRWLLPIVAVALLFFVWTKRTGPMFVLADIGERCSFCDSFTPLHLRIFPDPPYDYTDVLFTPIMPSVYYPKSAEHDWLKERRKSGDRAAYADLAGKLTIPYKSSRDQFIPARTDLDKWKAEYVGFMKRGEKIDPDNALYHLYLASFYWGESLTTKPPSGVIAVNDMYKLPVTNDKYFRMALSEYEKAVKARMYRYRLQKYDVPSQKIPVLFITEQYLDRREAVIYNDRNYVDTSIGLDTMNVKLSAIWLAEHNQLEAALKLLQLKSYFNMMTADRNSSVETVYDAAFQASGMAALTQYLLTKAHRAADAEKYGHVSRQLQYLVYGKLQQPITTEELYGIPWLSNIYTIQTGWTVAGYFCAWLWIVCCVGQGFWYTVRRWKPQEARNIDNAMVPERLGYICSAVVLAISMVLFVIQPKLGPSSVPCMVFAAVIPAVVYSVVMRYRYKQYCVQAGIPVPSRATEILCNWYAGLLTVVLFSAVSFLTEKLYITGIPFQMLLSMMAASLILAIPVMVVKSKTTDYYAKASQMWLRYLGLIVVWISLVGLPVMTVGEAILLQNDHFHLGMYKDVSKQQTEAKYLQLRDQVHKIISEVDAKGDR